jgi:PadR family transcriptional regulator, regulatory protein PadR
MLCMIPNIENWRTQIKKGYLELCILCLIETQERLYGFDILDQMAKLDVPLKEGTLYPLLNRMTADGLLQSVWETENIKGHPRKFYSLTKDGRKLLNEMRDEFDRMTSVYKKLSK